MCSGNEQMNLKPEQYELLNLKNRNECRLKKKLSVLLAMWGVVQGLDCVPLDSWKQRQKYSKNKIIKYND
jgi:hypothetical protein